MLMSTENKEIAKNWLEWISRIIIIALLVNLKSSENRLTRLEAENQAISTSIIEKMAQGNITHMEMNKRMDAFDERITQNATKISFIEGKIEQYHKLNP